MMNTKEQTETCNRLREFLQSIAILAVQAQDHIGNPDKVFDFLQDIEDDMMKARKQAERLIR